MEKLTDKKVVRLWRAALQLAYAALGNEAGTLTDRGEAVTLASALISAGLVSGDKMPRRTTHAGVDADQDAKLNAAYGDEI